MIPETNGKLKLSITVPEEMRKAYKDFQIAYVHSNNAKVIEPLSYDENTGELIFEANEFSTYALLGSKVVTPNTGDSTMTELLLILAVISVAGLILISRKKSVI